MTTKNENISYQKNVNLWKYQSKKVLFINDQYISATFVKSNENNELTKIGTPLTLILCAENEEKIIEALQLLESRSQIYFIAIFL